jgi:hypothetical protein
MAVFLLSARFQNDTAGYRAVPEAEHRATGEKRKMRFTGK